MPPDDDDDEEEEEEEAANANNAGSPSTSRRHLKVLAMQAYTGAIVLGTLIAYLLNVAGLVPVLVPTLLAWTANLLMWPGQSRGAQRQSLILIGAGSSALLWAAVQGQWLGWQQAFAVNLPLLGMFIALSFLGLANPEAEHERHPTGRAAILTTQLGTHLLGAVINLSVIFVFGDRLQRQGRLSLLQQTLMMRCFCAAAWWSPFFVATGVALTYAPGMQWRHTLLPGILMASLALGFTFFETQQRDRHEFEGYPLRPEALAMPLLLAAAVLLAHFLFSRVSILVLISLLAPLGGVIFMRERPRMATIRYFIHNRLSGVGNQFALFLAAGVFSSGIKSIISLYPDIISLGGLDFGPLLFAGLSGAMIIAGILGIHPVISISVVAPLLGPLNPDPTQLGFMYLTIWAISTGSSPLSGVGLIMIGRFGASAKTILSNNWYYAALMWLTASLVNGLLLA